MAKSEPTAAIWYATKADPMLAVEPVLWFRNPDGKTGVAEPVGWNGGQPESAVQAVLQAAGCVSGNPRTMRVQIWEDDAICVRHFGFSVPDSKWERALQTLQLLCGDLGGFTRVVVGQTGFHAPSHMVQILTLIWDRAGRPQWRSAQHVSAAPTKASGAPAELLPFVAIDKRARVSTSRFLNLEDGEDDVLTLQKTHMEVQTPVEVVPDKCEVCGGRLYEADGHYWCAKAATTDSTPDFEDS